MAAIVFTGKPEPDASMEKGYCSVQLLVLSDRMGHFRRQWLVVPSAGPQRAAHIETSEPSRKIQKVWFLVCEKVIANCRPHAAEIPKLKK